jgi:hypothetical protein
MAGGALALALALTTLNCFNEPLDPVAPRWDVNLTVPLSNRTITMQEIVERDSTVLRAGGGNQLTFVSTTNAAPTTVGDRVSVTPPDATGSIRLGAFIIALQNIVVNMQSPSLPSGSSMTVPPMTFDVPDVANAVNVQINARLASGTVRLTLTNAMDIPVSVTTPIELFDGSAVQASFVFSGAIPPHGSAWAEDNLAGRSITTGESLRGLHFSTTGSGGRTIAIPQYPLVATFSVSGLTASSATVTSLPAQRLSSPPSALALTDSTKIQLMSVRSGRLDLRFTNRMSIGVRLRFRFPELTKQGGGGLPYEDSVNIAAGLSQQYNANVAGCRLAAVAPGTLLDSVHVMSTIVIPVPVNGSVTLHDTDRVVVTMHAGTPLVADSGAVVLKPTWVDVRTVVPLDLAHLPTKFSGLLDIPAATLGLNLQSSMGFPSDLFLTVSARKATGDSTFLTLPASQRRIMPGSANVSFDNAEVGRFISDLSSRLPDSVVIAGRVLVNPPDCYVPAPSGVGRIGRNGSVGGTLDFRIPLRIGITNGLYQDTLAWGEGGSGDGSDRSAMDNMNTGTLFAEIQNGLPVQLGLSLGMLDKSRMSLMTLPQSGADIQVASASVDGFGSVTLPAASSTILTLSGVDVQKMRQTDFVRYALKLNTPAGAGPVSFTTANNVHLKIWMQLSYKVGK